MATPNSCALCAQPASLVVCDACVTRLGGRPELLHAVAESVAVPFVLKMPRQSWQDLCRCGGFKSRMAPRCRRCKVLAQTGVCGFINRKGVECQRRSMPGKRCHRCKDLKKSGAAPVDPVRTDEAKACLAALLVSMSKRSPRPEVRP